MTSARTFLRGTFLSAGGMIVSLLGGMVSLKLITNTPTLSEGDVGAYAMLIALSDFLLILNSFGMRAALPNLIGREPAHGQARVANAAIAWQAVVSAAAGGLLLAAWLTLPAPAAWEGNASWARLYPLLWVLPLLLFGATMSELLLAVQAGLGLYARRTAGLVFFTVVQVALVAGCVWMRGGSLPTLLLAVVAAHGAAALVRYALLGIPRAPAPPGPWLAGLRFAWPLYVNNLFGFVFQRVDTLLVGALLGPAAAGLFEMGAKKLPQYAVSLLNAAAVPFLPTFAARVGAGDRAGAARLLQQTYGGLATLGYAGVFLTLMVGAPMIRLLFSDVYVTALPALGWMMTAAVLTLQAGILGQALVALNRPHLVTLVNIALAAVSLGLNALLIPHFGMTGAGYAAVSSIIVSFLLHAACVRRSRLSLGAWVYARPHAAFLAALLIRLALGNGAGGSAAGLAVFLALAVAFRVVTPSQLERALRALLPERPPRPSP